MNLPWTPIRAIKVEIVVKLWLLKSEQWLLQFVFWIYRIIIYEILYMIQVLFKMQVRIAPPSRTSYSGNYVCMQKCLLALLGFIPQLNKMAILIWHPHRLSVHLTVIKCNILNEFIVLELSTLNLSRIKEWNKIIINLICNILIFRGKFIIYIYIHTVKPAHVVTSIKRSHFSCPLIEHFIWIEPLLGGHLSYKATFSWSQEWPLNTSLTVCVYIYI